MSAIATMISLRYAQMRGAFKRSRAQIVMFVIGIVVARVAVIGLGFGISALGGAVEGGSVTEIITASGAPGAGLVRSIFIVVAFVVGLMWLLIPLLYTGSGASVDPQRFVLFPIKDRTLQGGVFVSGLLGIPALAALVICLFSASGYRSVGVSAVVMEIVAGILAVVLFVSLSQALVALGSLYIRSTRGKAIFYVILFVVFICIVEIPTQLPAYFANTIDANALGVAQLLAFVGTLTTVLSWVPWSAPFQLPADIVTGDYAFFAIRLVMILAVIVLSFVISAWCMKRSRLTTGEVVNSRAQGLGWLGRVPDSPSGAVSGRVGIYWTRDPRLLMGLIVPLIIGVIFYFESMQSDGAALVLAYFVPIVVCWFFPMYEANNLSYDGTAFAMHLFTGVSGKDDRLGRARVSLLIGAVYLVVAFIITLFVTGVLATANGFSISIAVLGAGIAMLLCGIGVAEFISTFMMYPAANIKTPMKNPQGRSLVQVLFSLASIVIPAITLLPTIVVFIVLMVTGNIAMMWIVGVVGLANGIGILVAGIHLGGAYLQRHANSVLHKLENFSLLQS
jgi:ABC-2 type transport system permease protein